MIFSPALQEARLIKRYKRFLADVRLADGSQTTIHCPNTGSMRNCAPPGARVWFSESTNKTRKYPYTWELVEVDDRYKVGINTGRANALVKEALRDDVIVQLRAYATIKGEVRYGDEGSRIDFLLTGHAEDPAQHCYVEVKSVTLGLGSGLGAFPDAVTQRGVKHLRELMLMKEEGHRAVLLFCVQHEGIERVRAAHEIDPEYAALLERVHRAGVEVYAYRARIDTQAITLCEQVPVLF